MKKWLWMAVIVAVATTVVAAAQAEPTGRWPKFWERKKAVEDLALTPEQIAQLAEIDFKYAQSAIDLQAKAKIAQLNFDRLIKAGKTSDEEISKFIKEIVDARMKQTEQGLQRLVEVRKILNPQQWEKVSRMINRARGERGERGRGGREWTRKGGERTGGEKEGRGPSGPGKEGCPMMGGGMGGPAEGPAAPPAEK
jgi:Spy/CpxP family protein refolding chaperone